MIRGRVEALHRGHDISSFSSDDEALDRWLHRSARPTGGEGKNRTHLWLSEDDGEVLGFFTLAPAVVTTNEMTGDSAPSILLAKMALCERLRGSDPPVGPFLLLEAFRTAVAAADLIGGRFLVVDTQHERAARFYEANQFERIPGTNRLIIKMSAVRKVFA